MRYFYTKKNAIARTPLFCIRETLDALVLRHKLTYSYLKYVVRS